MSSLKIELVLIILQFLREEKYEETVHALERESGFFFNMFYFEEIVMNGDWVNVEKYLLGFMNLTSNKYSMKIFFEVRKQKYLEALDRNDRAKANDILIKDLRVFSSLHEDIFKELTQLLALDNFRVNEKLSKYVDAQSARGVMFTKVKKLLEVNPLVQEKLTYPHNLKNARLGTLINQSLNWQHRLCTNLNPNPQIKTLFVDHRCAQSHVPGARAPSPVPNPLMGAIPRHAGFPHLSIHGARAPSPVVNPFTGAIPKPAGFSHLSVLGARAPSPVPNPLMGAIPRPAGFSQLSPAPGPWMTNTPQVPHHSPFYFPIGLNSQSKSAHLPKRPKNPSTVNMARDQTVHYEHGLTRPFSMPDETNSVPTNVRHIGSSSQTHVQNPHTCDDLPVSVMMNLNQGAVVNSVDIHRDFSYAKSRTMEEYSQCRSLRLTYSSSSTPLKVPRLTYTNSGFGILALASNGVHKLWKWPQYDANTTGKANSNNEPMLWEPNGLAMTNDTSNVNSENAVPCFALSKHDSYVISASGGKISLFNMKTFKTLTTFMHPPPTATSLAFHPQDYNIIAIGMDDSSVQIYNVLVDELKAKLYGHQRRVTGLTFSNTLNVLVSSGADSQLFLWSTDIWEPKTSKYLQMPPGRATSPVVDTCIQFHRDEKHLLAVHETHIAIYEAPNLLCIKQWVPLETSGRITYATYSCDGHSIYASFEDGSVGVLTAFTLQLRCRINPSAYLPANPSLRVYPLVIAVHPTEPNQFALGLTDGGICILEPPESEGKWGTLPQPENGVDPST